MFSNILLIEDEESFHNTVCLMLRDQPVKIDWAKTGGEALNLYKKNPRRYAVVIADEVLPDINGSEVVRMILKVNSEQRILYSSQHKDPERLLNMLDVGGAQGFLDKDKPFESLKTLILNSISEYLRSSRVIGFDDYEKDKVERELGSIDITGKSRAMHEILEMIKICKASPHSAIVIGESGTGKELIARALVPNGKKFIAIDCAQFAESENLFEARLFGYVKGAFTGASENRPGLLAQADGNVAVFDELHLTSPVAQGKMLRLLQEMKYRRLGDNSGHEISLDCKIVAIAKPEIFQMLKDGRFSLDLYHRLDTFEIIVPSLRERTEDIELIVRRVQDEFNNGKPPQEQRQVSIATVNEMAKFDWVGNVRQLRSAVNRMLHVCRNRDGIVRPVDFEAYKKTKQDHGLSTRKTLPPLSESKSRLEIEQIIEALVLSRTLQETAARLGISRWTLGRKLIRFGIRAESYLGKTIKPKGGNENEDTKEVDRTCLPDHR